jgi:iron(III) transport system substrate-binding protein
MGRSRKATRTVVALVLASTSALLMACGSQNRQSDANPASGLTGQALVDAAKKDGSLTWYSTYTNNETQALIKRFNQAYPGITVNVAQGTAADLTARIATEQKGGAFKADLFQGDASYAEILLKSGALQAYSPQDEPTAPAALGLPAGYANVDAVLTTVIAYNPSVLKGMGIAAPASFDDLAKPEWKGKFSADDTAVNWYQSLIASQGHDRAKSLATALGANKPVLAESHTLALTQVQSGEPAGSIAIYGYLAAKTNRQSPDRLAFVNPNPLPSAPDLVDLVRRAPHPAAAELFMTWLMSKEGQTAIHEVSGRISLRTDVPAEGDAWDPTKWTPAWSNPSVDPAAIDGYQKELKQAFGSQ